MQDGLGAFTVALRRSVRSRDLRTKHASAQTGLFERRHAAVPAAGLTRPDEPARREPVGTGHARAGNAAIGSSLSGRKHHEPVRKTEPMTVSRLTVTACAGILGAVLMSIPASAAPLPAPSAGQTGTSATIDGNSLVTPVRNMGNGKHPSRPRGQKRRGMTSGGSRH
ncbi:hypothetical protein [Methylobacterium indicum]|uniref:hypothetical protein n=1 Tax=Methylobacterium indicum TaxID=1775910 RepID=UPI000B1AC0E3|nr:hypothetical protein [Methylobacterium indicum]